jgi:kinetochore protein Fta7
MYVVYVPYNLKYSLTNEVIVQRTLEARLSTTTNSIDLLKMEVEREEALLAKETKQVEEMEKNAKRAESERKRQMKNVCPPKLFCITPFCTATSLISDFIFQEHPVLRHLDSLPTREAHTSAPFSVLEGQDSDMALCDVWQEKALPWYAHLLISQIG